MKPAQRRMRKRAGTAQCWVVKPTILLIDDPFSELDVHTPQRLETELLDPCSLSQQTAVFVNLVQLCGSR